MINFLIEQKTENDAAVTSKYIEVIKKAFHSAGIQTNDLRHDSKPRNKKSFIFCDNILSSFKYFLLGFKNQIVWVQGVVPEESLMRRNSKIRYKILSVIEKKILKRSKLLFLVSQEMLNHYETKYNLHLNHKSIIMPCFNEDSVVENSFSSSKYQNNNFLYVGNLAEWQCFDFVAKAFSMIEKIAKVPVKLFVFTFDKDKARQILIEKKVVNFVVDFVPKDELSERIKNMKYGFVLRTNCLVNNVATPTKLSNYISNGIIPIFSDSLQSFSKVNEKHEIGIVCNVFDLEKGVEKVINHMQKSINPSIIKDKCLNIFADYYNQSKYISIIENKLLELGIKKTL